MTLDSIQGFKAKFLLEAGRGYDDPNVIKACVVDINIHERIQTIPDELKQVVAANPDHELLNKTLKLKAGGTKEKAGDPVSAFILAHWMVNDSQIDFSDTTKNHKEELAKLQVVYEKDPLLVNSATEPVDPARYGSGRIYAKLNYDDALKLFLGTDDFRSSFSKVRLITQQSFITKPNIDFIHFQALHSGSFNLNKLTNSDPRLLRYLDKLADYTIQVLGLNEESRCNRLPELNYIANIFKKMDYQPGLVSRIEALVPGHLTSEENAIWQRFDQPQNKKVSSILPLANDLQLQLVYRPADSNVCIVKQGNAVMQLDSNFTNSMFARQQTNWDLATGPGLNNYNKAISLLLTMDLEKGSGTPLVNDDNRNIATEVIQLIGYSRCPRDLINRELFADHSEALDALREEYVRAYPKDSVEIYSLAKHYCQEDKEARVIQSLLYQVEANQQRHDISSLAKVESKEYLSDKQEMNNWLQKAEVSSDQKKKLFHLMDLVANTYKCGYPNKDDWSYQELSIDEQRDKALFAIEINYLNWCSKLLNTSEHFADLDAQLEYRKNEVYRAHNLKG